MSTRMNKKDLGEWQERNCTDCPYSEPKTVGTGKPCCYDYTEVYGMNDELEQSKNEVELELINISHFHVVPDIIFRFRKSG